MGGYGALLLTLRHPDLFGFAGSISGAFAGPSGIEHVLPELKPSTDEAFGPPGSATRKENDLDTLIEGADPAKTPHMFLECGTSDPLLPSDRHVAAELSSRGFTYEYHELPGAHTWSFWDNSVPPLLDAVSRTLHLEESDATRRIPLR
jgi:S-formylglutathione hydrolase FrmB